MISTKWSDQVRRQGQSESDWSDGSGPQVPLPPVPCEAPAGQRINKPSRSVSCSKTKVPLKEKSNKGRVGDYTLQRVEVNMYEAEVEDSMKAKQLQHSQDYLHQTAQILEAQVLFCQSLDLKARAISKLTKFSGHLAKEDLTLTKPLAQALDAIKQDTGLFDELTEVRREALSATEALDQFYQVVDDFWEKRRDYQTATKNLILYLRTASRMSQSQPSKFQNEYDLIQSKYYLSRQKLESELHKLINEKQDVMADCFYKLISVQEKLLEQDKKFLIVVKEMFRCFQEFEKNHTTI